MAYLQNNPQAQSFQYNSRLNNKERNSKIDRWEKLYALGFERKERRDKIFIAKILLQKEKELDNCTFQPN